MSDPRTFAGLDAIGNYIGAISIASSGGPVDFSISGYPPPLFSDSWTQALGDLVGNDDGTITPAASGSLDSQARVPDWIWVRIVNGTAIGPYVATTGPPGDFIDWTGNNGWNEYEPSGTFTLDGGALSDGVLIVSGSPTYPWVVNSALHTWSPGGAGGYLERDQSDGLGYAGDPTHTHVTALFRPSEISSVLLAFAGAAGAIGPGDVAVQLRAFALPVVAGVITAGALSRGVRSRGRVVGRSITP